MFFVHIRTITNLVHGTILAQKIAPEKSFKFNVIICLLLQLIKCVHFIDMLSAIFEPKMSRYPHFFSC